jgi:hypothetical protein
MLCKYLFLGKEKNDSIKKSFIVPPVKTEGNYSKELLDIVYSIVNKVFFPFFFYFYFYLFYFSQKVNALQLMNY